MNSKEPISNVINVDKSMLLFQRFSYLLIIIFVSDHSIETLGINMLTLQYTNPVSWFN